jgi:xanthosine utilization system XapX-like protein
MRLLRAALLLSAAAAAALADLAPLSAQDRDMRLDTEAAQRLRAGTLLRVGSGSVDTVATAERLDPVRRGEMLVTIRREGPTLVDPAPRPALPEARGEEPVPAGFAEPRRPTRPARLAEPRPDPSDTPAEPEPVEAEPVVYDLGYTIEVGDRSGRPLRVLTPIVEVENGGLRYDPARRAYAGSILVGLVDQRNPAGHGGIPEPVWVQIAGGVRSVPPVPLSRINLPFERVELLVDRPAGDSVHIRLRPSFDPVGVMLGIPVHAARLTVTASPLRIAGMGLERSHLVVQGAEGGDSLRVTLTSVRGHPTPNQLWVTGAGGSAALRSAGVGRDTVNVLAGVYQGRVELEYLWPVSFLIAALVGGLIGGVLNGLSSHRRSDPRTFALLGVQGMLTGSMAAVLYSVGINVIGWAPDATYGEALMLAVAFLAGLVGPRVFDRVLPALAVERIDPPDSDAGTRPPETGGRDPAPAP